jgi:hypothetical protein
MHTDGEGELKVELLIADGKVEPVIFLIGLDVLDLFGILG